MSWLGATPFGGGWSVGCFLDQPFDALHKADLQLMHNQFDGIKVFLTVEAFSQIVIGIEASIKFVAQRTAKTLLPTDMTGDKRWQDFNNVADGHLIA